MTGSVTNNKPADILPGRVAAYALAQNPVSDTSGRRLTLTFNFETSSATNERNCQIWQYVKMLRTKSFSVTLISFLSDILRSDRTFSVKHRKIAVTSVFASKKSLIRIVA